MSLAEIFNTSSDDMIAKEMRARYFDSAEQRARIKAATQRKRLYMGGGTDTMKDLLGRDWYEDDRNAEARKKFVDVARFDNGARRIVHELATLYRLQPTRTVTGADNNKRYQALLKTTRHDELMRRGERMCWLQNSVFLRARVQTWRDQRRPVTDVLTQNQFHAIGLPDDPLHFVGIAIDHHMRGAKETAKRWMVWTETEIVWFDSQGRLMQETRAPNPLGILPGVLVHREPPDETLLEMVSGSDIEAAGWARWFVSILLIKETKSVTRQTILSGDLSSTPDGQQLDTDAETLVGEGVGAQTLERGVDLSQFMDVGDHIVDRAAANHGISPQTMRQTGATSGAEADLRRVPQEEQRIQQLLVWRTAEREFAQVQARVMALEGAQESEFDPRGWRIDYAEPARHMSQTDRFALRQTKRSMGHSNIFMELMEDNPDLDEAGAKKAAMDIQQGHALWIETQRALNMSPSATTEDPGQSPAANGALNGSSTGPVNGEVDTGDTPPPES